MPPAGATQVHPHMQVVLTANPGNALARELAAEKRFMQSHGRVYLEELVRAEEHAGERWVGRCGSVAWLAPFAPTGLLGDCWAVFPECATIADLADAHIGDFAAGLARVLRAFAGKGLWSFNLTFFPDQFGSTSGAHRLSARILPRFYLNPKLHVSDASYLQLLLEERFAMIYPEQNAALLREAFGDSAA